MRLLLDTHIALWAVADDPRLALKARVLIEDLTNEVFVSVVTLWEIAIKFALSHGRANGMPIGSDLAEHYFRTAGYALIDVTARDVRALAEIAMHHADPFDRMLVAQAISAPFRLVTHDPAMVPYGDFVLRV